MVIDKVVYRYFITAASVMNLFAISVAFFCKLFYGIIFTIEAVTVGEQYPGAFILSSLLIM